MKLEAKQDSDELTIEEINFIKNRVKNPYLIDLSGSILSLRQIEQVFSIIRHGLFHLDLTGCKTTSKEATAKLLECLGNSRLLFLHLTGAEILFDEDAALRIFRNITGIYLGDQKLQQLKLDKIFNCARMTTMGMVKISGITEFRMTDVDALVSLIRANNSELTTLSLDGLQVADRERMIVIEKLAQAFKENRYLNIVELNGKLFHARSPKKINAEDLKIVFPTSTTTEEKKATSESSKSSLLWKNIPEISKVEATSVDLAPQKHHFGA